MDTSDLAMVSRIRVEVRGGSMEAAEKVAFMLLDHARMAGYLEGVVGSSSEYTDHFFNRPAVTKKFDGGPPEPWGELGLPYAGRLSVAFEPGVVSGGIRQFGKLVFERELAEPGEAEEGEGGYKRFDGDTGSLAEITAGSMVLIRERPVTRESELRPVEEGLLEVDLGPAKPDEHEMRAFAIIAGDEYVSDIGFGRAASRQGWEITLSYMVPMRGNGSLVATGIGGRSVIFGETFSEALVRTQRVLAEAKEASRTGVLTVGPSE